MIGAVVIYTYMFPSFVNNSLLQLKDKKGNALVKPFFAGEVLFNNLMILFGIVFAFLGTWVSLTSEGH
jgi:hypothetical protein